MRLLEKTAAISGFLRAAPGLALLRANIRRQRGGDPMDAARSAWTLGLRLRPVLTGLQCYENRFGHGWKDLLLLLLTEELAKCGLGRPPDMTVKGLELLRARAAARRPTVVVTMHAPTDAVLNRLFEENGCPSTLLAARGAKIRRKARLLGLRGELDVIERSSDSFLSLRARMAEGRVVCCCVDFTEPRKDSLLHDVRVSPAMFQMAKLLRSSILYAETRATADGAILVSLAEPSVDTAAVDAGACCADFVSWLTEQQGDGRDIGIADWPGDFVGSAGFFAQAPNIAHSD